MAIATDLDERIRAHERALYAHYHLDPIERTVTVDQLAVRLTEFTPPTVASQPTVLLLHGIASITAAAAPLLEYLAAGRRVIAVDWPGHGLSGPITLPRGASIRAHAVRTLRGLHAELGLDRADMVGHSMGAQFALYLAVDAPELVGKLVLIGAPGAGFAGARPVPAMRVLSVPGLGAALLRAPLSKAAYKRNNDAMTGRGVIDRYPSDLLDIGYLAGQRPGFAPSVSSFFRALITPRAIRPGVPVPISDLASLVAATLLVWGTEDVFMTPHKASASINAIPRHTLLTVPGAGHLPWLNDPQLCGKTIIEFLDSP
jgi:pimeloyl-ACP methyl ester carboxylesterase